MSKKGVPPLGEPATLPSMRLGTVFLRAELELGMAVTRRLHALPIPGAELARLRDELAPDYGSHVWQDPEQGLRVLVVRVPRDEPDIVNDVEQAAQRLPVDQLDQVSQALLVGNARTYLLPAQVLADQVAARVRFDRNQCHALRAQLKPGEHHLFRAPEDAHRLMRLALRVSRPRVADVREEDVAAFAGVLGPLATAAGYREAQVLYLIADKDDVRLEAGPFLADVAQRHAEGLERSRLAAQIVAKEAANRAAAQSPPRPPAQLAEPAIAWVPARLERVAVGPLRRAPDADALHAAVDAVVGPGSGTSAGAAGGPRSASPVVAVGGPGFEPAVEGASGPRRASAADVRSPASVGFGAADLFPPPTGQPLSGFAFHDADPNASNPCATPPSPPLGIPVPLPLAVRRANADVPVAEVEATVAADPVTAAARARLEHLGFAVLANPPGPHGIDLAGERPEGFPARVILLVRPRLDRAVADATIAAARALGAHAALVIAPEADLEGRRRLIATKVRWLAPGDLGALDW